MRGVFVLTVTLLGVVVTDSRNRCSMYPPNNRPRTSLDDKLKLTDDVLVRFLTTNWPSSTIESFKESSIGNFISVLKDGRSETLSFSSVRGSGVAVNRTGNTCTAQVSPSFMSLPASIVKYIGGSPNTSIDLVQLIVELSKKQQGYLGDNESPVIVSGVAGVDWILCLNATGTNTTEVFQLNVVFAGDKSIEPIGRKNPVPLSIRLTAFTNVTDPASKVVDDYLVTFTSFERPTLDDPDFAIPSGIVCFGLPESSPNLTAALPVEFSSTVHWGGVPKETNSKVSYSSKVPMVAVSSPLVESIMPFINEKNLLENTETVVHHFGTGLEYSFNAAGGCLRTTALPNDTSDVGHDGEQIVLAPSFNLFVPSSAQKWSRYNDLVSPDGTVLVYRASTGGNSTVEIELLGSTLRKVTQYMKNSTGAVNVMSSARILLDSIDKSFADLLHVCYSPRKNSSFAVVFREKSFSSVSSQLTRAITKQIDELAAISQSRIRVSYVPTLSDGVQAVLSFAEASPEQSAPVKGKKNESSVETVIAKLNATISAGDWKVSFTDSVGKQQEWIVAAQSFTTFPVPQPDQPKPFQGYTGGAMFVLAVFMLLLGVGIGAGGLFFVTRRQRISTLAYQVFE